MTDAHSCGIPRSYNILRTYNIILPASHAAMNSASVDERAGVGCSFVLYPMVPPAKRRHTPVNDRLVSGQVAQSESTNACRSSAKCVGRSSSSREPKDCFYVEVVLYLADPFEVPNASNKSHQNVFREDIACNVLPLGNVRR